jgi:hypothetical protein
VEPAVEHVEDRQQLALGGVGCLARAGGDEAEGPAAFALLQEAFDEVVLAGEVPVQRSTVVVPLVMG